MADLDTLPGDQRAVLTLVLGRGRSYADIAGMLTIDPDAVSGRALAALDALGPPSAVPRADRQWICDYLLGQLAGDDAATVRERLAGSAVERAWARVVAAELAPLAREPLPEIPLDTAAPPSAPAPTPAPGAPAPPASRTAAPAPRAPAAAPDPEPDPPRPEALPGRAPDGTENPRRSSRRGGAAVLVVVAIVIAAIVVLATRGHAHHPASPSAGATAPSATTPAGSSTSTTSSSSSTTAASATPVAQINLNPTASGSSATAIADVFQNGSVRELAIIGQSIPANTSHNSYEVWLYNSRSDAVALGFVNPAVTSTGKLSVGAPLPTNAAHYHQIIVTTETARKPATPGPILLAGRISGL